MISYVRCVIFSFRETTEVLHRVFTPIRIYYHFTRWLSGHDYDPFATNVKHGLHPLFVFMMKQEKIIRFIYYDLRNYIITLSIAIIIHLIQYYFFLKQY